MHRSVFINYAANNTPLAGFGTTLLWMIVAVVTVNLAKNQMNNPDRDVITKSLIPRNVVLSSVFEPPDDNSPDRTSGLGSRSSRQGVFNA